MGSWDAPGGSPFCSVEHSSGGVVYPPHTSGDAKESHQWLLAASIGNFILVLIGTVANFKRVITEGSKSFVEKGQHHTHTDTYIYIYVYTYTHTSHVYCNSLIMYQY